MLEVASAADTLDQLYSVRKKNLYLRTWNDTPLCGGCEELRRGVQKSECARRRELRIPRE